MNEENNLSFAEYMYELARNGFEITLACPEVFDVGLHIELEGRGLCRSEFVPYGDFCGNISKEAVLHTKLEEMAKSICDEWNRKYAYTGKRW